MNNINQSGQIITVGGIKNLSNGYNKNQLIQTRVLIQALQISVNNQNEINQITSDRIITPVEKTTLLRVSNEIDDQKAILYNQYSDYSLLTNIAWTDYNQAYQTLKNLLILILANMDTTYELTDSQNLSGFFTDYYEKKTIATSTLSAYVQLVMAKISQFGIKVNVSDFLGTEENGSIYIHGFNGTGDPSDGDGNILYLGTRIDISKGRHVTGFTNKKGYIYVTISTWIVGTCYYSASDNTFKTSSSIQVDETGNIVIGEFTATSGVLGPVLTYTQAKPFTQLRNNEFLNILIGASDASDMNNMLNNLAATFIEWLVTTNIITKNFTAANMKIGAGNVDSGFMFRADYDNGDPLTGNPRFDVFFNGNQILKIDPTSGDILIGDYDGGAGAKWIQSLEKFSVKGSVEADEGIWHGSIAVDQLETLDGYTYAIASTDRQDVVRAALLLVKQKGNVSSGSISYYPAPTITDLGAITGASTGSFNAAKLIDGYCLMGYTTFCFYKFSDSTWSVKDYPTMGISQSVPYCALMGALAMVVAGAAGMISYKYFPYDLSGVAGFSNVTMASGATWRGIGNASNKMLIVGSSGYVAYSALGNGWTTEMVVGDGTYSWLACSRSSVDDTWVIGGENGKVAYSTDHTNWTVITVDTVDWTSVVHCKNLNVWVMVGKSGKVAYSHDMANWTVYTEGSTDWNSVEVDESNRFYIGGDNGVLKYSDNYKKWTALSFSTYSTKGLFCPYSYSKLLVTTGKAGLAAQRLFTIDTDTFTSSSISVINKKTEDTGEVLVYADGVESKGFYLFGEDTDVLGSLSAVLEQKILVKKNLVLDTGVDLEEL